MFGTAGDGDLVSVAHPLADRSQFHKKIQGNCNKNFGETK
jgi:hypothetical protein